MAIILRLDRMMADRKISLNELSEKVGIANVNLSKIKTGKVSAIRFSTLDAICEALDCQPGDILEFQRRKMIKEKTNPLCFEKNTRFRSLFHKNRNLLLFVFEKGCIIIPSMGLSDP